GDDGVFPGSGLLLHAPPARARDERVDREVLRQRQDDLRRGRVRLLGRDREAVELQLPGERDRGVHACMRRRAGSRGERGGGGEECGTKSHLRSFQATWRVKGAVRIRPATLHWRKRRQVPGAGTSTPTVSFPGDDEVPVTFAGPRMLVQPVAPGEQTCVWK